MIRQFEGDAEIMEEVVGLFLADYPNEMNAIREAVRDGDATSLAQSAHALKGAVAAFGTGEAFEAARQLEEIGRSGNLSGAPGANTALEEALKSLTAVLQRMLPAPTG
jgi:protein-histidine pros-kinase